jgi:osmoprotectant transport system ATP-binding protein
MDDPLQQVFNRLRSSGAGGSSGANEVLLLDRRGRPYRWLRRGDLMRATGSPARAGTPVHTTVTRDATLRDALEAVLTDRTGRGRVAVTGRHGEYVGVVDIQTLLSSVHGVLEAERRRGREG